MMILLLGSLLIWVQAAGQMGPVTGVWELDHDDDRPGEQLKEETMMLFPDGRLVVMTAKRVHDVEYKVEGQTFIIILPNGKQISNTIEVTQEELKLKDEGPGWVHYRRSHMPLPTRPDSIGWNAKRIGPLKVDHPGDWLVMEDAEDDDVTLAFVDEEGPSNLIFTVVRQHRDLDSQTIQASLEAAVREFVKSLPGDDASPLEKSNEGFFLREEHSMEVFRRVAGERFAIHACMRKQGEYLVLIVIMARAQESRDPHILQSLSSLEIEGTPFFEDSDHAGLRTP